MRKEQEQISIYFVISSIACMLFCSMCFSAGFIIWSDYNNTTQEQSSCIESKK